MANKVNADSRKAWLRNYRTFPVWYYDPNIGVTYYKYDFDDDTHLIVDEYTTVVGGRELTTGYYHLVGGPLPPVDSNGVPRWERHSEYERFPDSETYLLRFLQYWEKAADWHEDDGR